MSRPAVLATGARRCEAPVCENVRRSAESLAERLHVSAREVLRAWWGAGIISAAEFVAADR